MCSTRRVVLSLAEEKGVRGFILGVVREMWGRGTIIEMKSEDSGGKTGGSTPMGLGMHPFQRVGVEVARA